MLCKCVLFDMFKLLTMSLIGLVALINYYNLALISKWNHTHTQLYDVKS